MSDKWVLGNKRLEKAVGKTKALEIEEAMQAGQVEKKLLHVNSSGELTQYSIDSKGNIVPLS